MDPVELGRRLRSARENRSLTQDEVAKALGMTRTAVVKIESGDRSVSTLELAGLAELYACPILRFFSDGAPEEEGVLVALHRLDPSFSEEPKVQQAVSHAIELFEAGVSLERLLGRARRAGPPAYSLPEPRSTMDAIVQGTEIAEEERERLGLGKMPIPDMAELLSSEGIWATGINLPDSMSGFFLCHRRIGMAVAVNFHHPSGRKRFSYAHEYAHALLDRAQHATVSTRENSNDLIEKRANSFAAAFLMPKAGVHHQLHLLQKGLPRRLEEPMYSVAGDEGIEARGRAGRSQDMTSQEVARVGHHFGVSFQAMVYRLLNLGEIRKQNCEALLEPESHDRGARYMKLLEELDGADRSGGDPQRELVKQVYFLALEAYQREEISGGRLRDIARKLGPVGRKLLDAEAARGI